MSDPRLNSLHLEPARRQDFRRARHQLLQSCGSQTLCVDGVRAQGRGTDSPTLISRDAPPPETLTCWLVDREFLYPLKVGVNTLGRCRDSDVVVEDDFVSCRHCAVVVHQTGACELHDTASRNGTYVNGTRVAGPVLLQSGDEVRVCNRQFTFLARPR
jgi:hypothetical protein